MIILWQWIFLQDFENHFFSIQPLHEFTNDYIYVYSSRRKYAGIFRCPKLVSGPKTHDTVEMKRKKEQFASMVMVNNSFHNLLPPRVDKKEDNRLSAEQHTTNTHTHTATHTLMHMKTILLRLKLTTNIFIPLHLQKKDFIYNELLLVE